MALADAPAGIGSLVTLLAPDVRPDDDPGLGRPDDRALGAADGSVARPRHVTLQQGDAAIAALAAPSGFSPVFLRHDQARLALATLLQQAVVFAARHQATIQQRLGLDQLGFKVIQLVCGGRHGARGPAHFSALIPVLHLGRLLLGLQPGGLGFGAAATDIGGIQLDQHLPSLDLLAVGEPQAEHRRLERRNQVDAVPRRDAAGEVGGNNKRRPLHHKALLGQAVASRLVAASRHAQQQAAPDHDGGADVEPASPCQAP
ncbi:hypothetical protein D3C87_1189370 [compost metagenome]